MPAAGKFASANSASEVMVTIRQNSAIDIFHFSGFGQEGAQPPSAALSFRAPPRACAYGRSTIITAAHGIIVGGLVITCHLTPALSEAL